MLKEIKQVAREILDWIFDDWKEMKGYSDESVMTALRHCLEYKAYAFSTFRNVLSMLPGKKEVVGTMVTVCGRCREDLPTDVTRPLAYYDLAMPTSN